MTHPPHVELIDRFYAAFAQRDGATMAACYHPQATFSDPAFPDLRGTQIGAMWTMLCERGKDLELEWSAVEADDRQGSAHWRARYTFSASGRRVDNRIAASFDFEDGLIRRHRDDFDFYRWARQALGLHGLLLGWSGFLQRQVQAKAGAQLKRYIERHG